MGWGLYIHIPFCRQKCFYCDFPSFAGKEAWMERYISALCREIAEKRELSADAGEAATVYAGGGTPTALPRELLVRVLETVREHIPVRENAEITIEANPGTVDAEYLRVLRKAGANRISFGVQSFSDVLLRRIGRIHSPEEAQDAVRLARSAGFRNISLDLMYGLPGQTMKDLEESIAAACSLEPQHISIYGLQVEEGTVFARQQSMGKLVLPPEELAEEMYDYMTDSLPAHGYRRYEISNFAREGFESRHNLGYWQDIPYLGCGAAAHSYWENRRWNHPQDPTEYMTAVERGEPLIRNEESLSRETAMEEFCFLALRTVKGIDKQSFQNKFQCTLESVYSSVIRRMKEQKLLEETENQIRLTQSGMKFGNVVFREFIL